MKYATATVQELADALKNKKVSAVELVQEARRIVAEKDTDIHAFIEIFDDAMEDAQRADKMIAAGKATPLTGIPIAIKDNFCIQGKEVTCASRILEGFRSPYDATVIQKLRDAGAVIFGRTNMDEFAMGSSTEHSIYGTTKNPHDITRVAGGSSGGSAAAVAMGAVPLAIGSDTGGSVRQPASFCGTVGLKPTYGAVSRHGLIALASSLDVVGVFSRNVADAQVLFDTIRDEKNKYDSTINIYAPNDTTPGVESNKIGVPREMDEIDITPEVAKAYKRALEILQEKGKEIVTIDLPLLHKAASLYYIIQPAEASSNLARFDGIRYGKRGEGEDVWQEYLASRGDGFGSEVVRRIVVGTYVLSAGYYDAYYKTAVQAREAMRKEFLQALHIAPIIVMPTTPGVAFIEGEKKRPTDMYAEDRLTLQANLTGLPAVTVPMQTDGLPIGLQFIGGYHREHELFDCARVFTA